MTDDLESPRALIVDDDPDFVALLSVALKTLGVAVDAHTTVEPFLKQLRVSKPSLCIIDLHIGKEAVGFSVIKAIRGVMGDELPLIVASSTKDPSTVAHALELGADDYFAKPIDLTVLAAKLKNYVTSRKLRDLKTEYYTVSPELTPARLTLDVELLSVDELGLRVRAPHLFRKGMRVEIMAPVLGEVCGTERLMTVVEFNSVNPETGHIEAYCEFDPADENLLGNVRRWLAKKAA